SFRAVQLSAAPLWVRLAPPATIGLLVGPVAAGLIGVLAPAFGFAPMFGRPSLSLAPFAEMLAEPGIGTSIWLSLWIGPATALVSLAVVALVLAATAGGRLLAPIAGLFRPILAIPH